MRVVLVDDHALFRAGIASLLRAWDFDVVGEAGDGVEALEAVRRTRPDLVLMDIRMPHAGGLEATRRILAELPDTKIVMVTVSHDDDDLFQAIKAGAHGYLLKDMSQEDFSATISGIAAGEAPLSPGLAVKILQEFSRSSREHRPKGVGPDELTEREREVLQHLATGATNREIAASIFLSEHTVRFHMKNILSKLHVKNRAQAVAYAYQRGLAEPAEAMPELSG